MRKVACMENSAQLARQEQGLAVQAGQPAELVLIGSEGHDFVPIVGHDRLDFFLPRETRFAPKRESLEWRLEQLRHHGD
jgi:hypothetical protein